MRLDAGRREVGAVRFEENYADYVVADVTLPLKLSQTDNNNK